MGYVSEGSQVSWEARTETITQDTKRCLLYVKTDV